MYLSLCPCVSISVYTMSQNIINLKLEHIVVYENSLPDIYKQNLLILSHLSDSVQCDRCLYFQEWAPYGLGIGLSAV